MIIAEKTQLIIDAVKKEKSVNPARIFKNIASKEYVSIHGPEHHILDGACLLVAFANAGGNIQLDDATEKIVAEGLKMPGAMCGLWGVCGAVTSLGAALSIIDETGPLTSDGSWGNHMLFTSKAIFEIGKINGPRCCKRDAMIALKNAVDYVNQTYDVKLEFEYEKCEFSSQNIQCIRHRCPFFAN